MFTTKERKTGLMIHGVGTDSKRVRDKVDRHETMALRKTLIIRFPKEQEVRLKMTFLSEN